MPDTKTRILDTAEKLFAKHGIQGTGLRLISQKAGVNLAAVNYHFGSKENLVRTVLSRLILPLDQERNRLLEQAEAAAGDAGSRVEDIVRAFLMPWISFRRKHPQYVRMLSMIYSGQSRTNGLFRDMIREASREAYALFTRALFRALPGVPREVLLMRTNLAVAMATAFLLNHWVVEGLEELSGQEIPEKTLLHHVVNLIESGLPGEETSR